MADKWIQLMSEDGTDNLFPTSKMDLLWTNASPSSSFAEQTISIDLSSYSAVVVETVHDEDGAPYGFNFICEKNRQTTLTTFSMRVTFRVRRRGCTVTDAGISFLDAYDSASWENNSKLNNVAVPFKIYGIK